MSRYDIHHMYLCTQKQQISIHMTQELQYKIESIINRNPQADDKEIVFQLKHLLYETDLQRFTADKETKSISDLVAENMRKLCEGTYPNDMIKSGFDDFDRQLGGFRLGEFIVIGGRPAMGKTQLLINLSLNISITRPLLYVTLDLSDFLLTNRFMASVFKIPVDSFLRNQFNEEQIIKLSSADEDEFSKRQLFIHDGSCTVDEITAHCKKQIQENGIQVIVVDYLQLMKSYKLRNREQEVSYISRELKNLAKEYNVCVIASSQVNRSVDYRTGMEGKHPQLSDLRESGAIEQDADKVIFIYRPEYDKIFEDADGNSLINLVKIIVLKNRNGRLGDFNLLRDDNFTNFFTNFENFTKHKNEFSFLPDRLLELEDKEEMPF